MIETLIYFRCHACTSDAFVKECEDPTSAKGCCKNCGDVNWSLYETSLTPAEFFKMKLAGKRIFPRSYITERIA